MNPKFTLFLLFAVPLFCMAQTQLAHEYSYDASGCIRPPPLFPCPAFPKACIFWK